MSASVLLDETKNRALGELLHPPGLDAAAPEERLVVCGLDWDRYLAFDQVLGHDRPGPQLFYLDGSLEIMTASNEHERLKRLIGAFIDFYLDEVDVEVFTHGQATRRDALLKVGAEPDESWCLGTEKPMPDIVLEIALTSGGLNKLEIYGRLRVPEVWFWRKGQLEFHVFDGGAYRAVPRSELLPQVDPELIRRCLAVPSWKEARRLFRSGMGAA